MQIEVTQPFPASEELIVAPLGDIQYLGDKSRVSGGLNSHLLHCRERNAYFIGMGDYLDVASPSNRAKLRAAGLYDNTEEAIENAVQELNLKLYTNYLAETKGRWLGLLSGHHLFQYEDGRTSDTELCEMLEAPHLGDCAAVRIPFSNGLYVTIWCHHGSGSSSTSYGPLTKLERIAQHFDADLYLMGHMTKKAVSSVQRVFVGPGDYGPELKCREAYLVGTGGWSKAYLQGHKRGQVHQGEYVEKRMMAPVALGAPIIRICPWQPDKVITVEV